uniref:Tudor domain-containing protein n=1 Tax=Ixodes ricinus TaxID=34613 RepID=A0A131XSY0_IXORI
MQVPPIPELTDIPMKVPLPVWVSNFISPTKFWLRLKNNKHRDPYIRDFVRGQTEHFYTLNVGAYCVANTGRNFDLARAFELDIQKDGFGMPISAEVFCVDYGLTLVLGMNKLFPLSQIDAKIPCLAVPCSLRRLTSPSSTRLRDMVDWCVRPDAELEAVFYGTSEAGVYQVDMFVMTGENGQVRMNVAEDLIDRGIATRIWYPLPPQRGKITASSSKAPHH